MKYPRLKALVPKGPRLFALGTLLLGEAYDPVLNPLIFNLDYPGHEQHGSSITLATFKKLIKAMS